MYNRNSGFTLVELSIVLVIIGLLIGGILVAQSMINSATIQAQIKQIQELDAGLNNFQTKYKSLPGDTNIFSNPGNNDGFIEPDSGMTGYNRAAFTGESIFVWPEMQQALGMFSGFTFNTTYFCSGGYICSATPPNLNIIPSKLAKNSGIILAYDDQYYQTRYNSYNFGVVYEDISGADRTNSNPVNQPLIPCTSILAIDAKLDDGKETTGIVRGGYSSVNNCTSLGNKGIMMVKAQSQGN